MRTPYRFSSSDDDAGDAHSGDVRGPGDKPAASGLGVDELPFRVELWDADKKVVEQLLALTASGGIGFAAYHAATVEYPNRYIVLRHRHTILSRCNGPSH